MKRRETRENLTPTPTKPDQLPPTVKWLSGEGCGSWFHIDQFGNYYRVIRYSPDGKEECNGLFWQVLGTPINLDSDYQFTYLSHCAEVNITQNGCFLKFKNAQLADK